MEITVRLDEDRERYELLADGAPAGFTAYRARPGLIAFMHTEIDPAYEGHGLASRLIEAALDDARERGLAVLPFCPFVNGYIKRHVAYVELVPDAYRAQFGLA